MFGCSDSLNNFLSFCSFKEEQLGYDNMGGYSKEFQAMLDNLDQEDNSEDCGPISGRKRRLRLDQVKGLEKHFEMENKLEPERKIKIAAELELEPRQVTIWFQNRRARWKTKQLEKDYGILKFNYDALKLDYEVLEKENATLASKLRKLREKLSRQGEERNLKSDSKGVGNEAGDGNYSFLLGNNNNNSSVSSSMAISGEFMMKMKEEHQSLFTSEEPCNFCSVDQAPSLHWY